MKTTAVPVKIFGNVEKNIIKIAIYAETDQNRNVFYKIEGQTGLETTAIAFIYDIEKAVEELKNITKDILTRQTLDLLIK